MAGCPILCVRSQVLIAGSGHVAPSDPQMVHGIDAPQAARRRGHQVNWESPEGPALKTREQRKWAGGFGVTIVVVYYGMLRLAANPDRAGQVGASR